MALQIIDQPSTEPDAGLFNLPAEFDREEHSAKWAQSGHDVSRCLQRENLIGAGGISADGWTVWKDSKGQLHKVKTSKHEYVLMFRPRSVQIAVNAVYGNVGKKRMMAEKVAAATSSTDTRATGMLSDAALSQAGYREPQQDEFTVQLNHVEIEQPRITPPPLDLKPS